MTATETGVRRPASVAANARALLVLQLANYAIPLLVLPVLIGRLGTDAYGVIATAYATVMFFVFAVDAGFNTIAARELAKVRTSTIAITRIYAATQWMRAFVALLCGVVLLGLVQFVPALSQHKDVYRVTGLLIIGTFLFPTWLFQGLQVMQMTTICAVFGRIVVSLLILVWVDSTDDIVMAAGLQAAGTLVAGIVAQATTIRRMGFRFFLPLRDVLPVAKRLVVEVRFLAPSELLMNIANNCSVFLLSLMANQSLVGIYAALEKIVKAIASGFQPIIRALYPYVSERAGTHYESAKRLARRWVLITTLLSLIVGLITAFSSHQIVNILLGSEFFTFEWILQCLQIWVVCHVAVSVFGQLSVMALGQTQRFAGSLALGAIAQAAAACILTYYVGVAGLIAALVIGEFAKIIAYGVTAKPRERTSCVS